MIPKSGSTTNSHSAAAPKHGGVSGSTSHTHSIPKFPGGKARPAPQKRLSMRPQPRVMSSLNLGKFDEPDNTPKQSPVLHKKLNF